MPTIAKKKAKMIVKDGNGDYLQLLPETEVDAELDEESSNPVASSAIAEALSGIEDAASNMGAIKVMDEEPTALNTTEYAGETLIAWVQPAETWSYTINTNYWGTNFSETEVPFSLYGTQDASIVIYWGDGTSTTHTSNDAVADRFPSHTYNSPGEYTIEIESCDFERIYIDTFCGDWEDYWDYGSRMFSLQLKTINSPFPKLAGIVGKWNNVVECKANSFYYLFNYFNNLVEIPKDLFAYNPHIVDFTGCFNYCTALTFIPSGLFDKNTAATSFANCFRNCSSLQSIPTGLFDKNTAVTTFEGCFFDCSSIQSIPSGLFDKNTVVTNLSYCFYYSSINDFTLHIGSSSVSDCDNFLVYSYNSNNNYNRTIYVPSGSTTQTSFNEIAQYIFATIIGE